MMLLNMEVLFREMYNSSIVVFVLFHQNYSTNYCVLNFSFYELIIDYFNVIIQIILLLKNTSVNHNMLFIT